MPRLEFDTEKRLELHGGWKRTVRDATAFFRECEGRNTLTTL